jgi:hypothetical protein
LAPYAPFEGELLALERTTPKAQQLSLVARMSAVAKEQEEAVEEPQAHHVAVGAGTGSILGAILGATPGAVAEAQRAEGSSQRPNGLPVRAEGLHGRASELGLGGVASYVGWWVHGGKSGEGVEVFFDGSEYQGGFEAGQRHGEGRLVWAATGDVYDGRFENGLMHGYGVYVYSRRPGDGLGDRDSDQEDGDSGHESGGGGGKRPGSGARRGGRGPAGEEGGAAANSEAAAAANSVAFAPTAAVAAFAPAAVAPAGDPRDASSAPRDPTHARGAAAAQHNWRAPVDQRSRFFYAGAWSAGCKSGAGRFVWAGPGDEYVGEWQRDGRGGEGVFQHGDGRRYEGSFAQGWKDGFGAQTWGDRKGAARYEGSWARGQMHGGGEGPMPTCAPPSPDACGDPSGEQIDAGGKGAPAEDVAAAAAVTPLAELAAFTAKADAAAAVEALAEAARRRGEIEVLPPPKPGGTYRFSDGRRYTGGFWKGRPHCASGGEGVTADGRRYHEGAWEFGAAVKFNPKGRRQPTLVAAPPWPLTPSSPAPENEERDGWIV